MSDPFTGFTGGRIDRFEFTMTMLGTFIFVLLWGAMLLRIPHGSALVPYAFISAVPVLFGAPWIVLVSSLKRARDIGWNVLWVAVLCCLAWVPVVLVLAFIPTDYARRNQQTI